jgi:hypothetical protein
MRVSLSFKYLIGFASVGQITFKMVRTYAVYFKYL